MPRTTSLPVEALKFHWNRGDSIDSIAARFNTTRGTIVSYTHHHRDDFPNRNATFKHLTKSETERMLRLHRKGVTQTEIAKALGKTQSGISHALKRHGF